MLLELQRELLAKSLVNDAVHGACVNTNRFVAVEYPTDSSVDCRLADVQAQVALQTVRHF